jgi:hypothetical protein
MGVGVDDTKQAGRAERDNLMLGKDSGHLWELLGISKEEKHALSAGISFGRTKFRRSKVVSPIVHAGHYVASVTAISQIMFKWS